MFQALTQADYVLNACGRPHPPRGYRFVDLPRIIPYRRLFPLNSTPPAFVQDTVSNAGQVPFYVRGIIFDVAQAIPPIQFQIKWPNGRFLIQNGLTVSDGGVAILQGIGASTLALRNEVEILPGARITMQLTGMTALDQVDVQFVGVLRYLLKVSGAPARPANVSPITEASCLIGYPARGNGGGGAIDMIPNPLDSISDLPRYRCSPDQNIMAPEWMLGNQCQTETPAGFRDEPFTFFSPAFAVAAGGSINGQNVVIPGDADFVIRRFRPAVAFDPGVTGIPTFALRLANGYSVTGGDLVPIQLGTWWPFFPALRVQAGGRLIIDMANIQFAGVGNITTTIEFDGVKRRPL